MINRERTNSLSNGNNGNDYALNSAASGKSQPSITMYAEVSVYALNGIMEWWNIGVKRKQPYE